ncbi:hypothetical protein AX17_001273 [Amanita inopinata Kibby_2008]|nr:hypothetical protein AX17_001273 [Amanita inopinata Kibby_2008]
MSRPPINPDKSVAGIALDPQTLQRIVPESKRSDGSVRKQLKIRPGFTPQEDVRRFRGTKQAQMDASTLPKGHIIGWVPPSSTSPNASEKPVSKSAKKNAKRKEKRAEKQTDKVVPESWEDDEEAPATTAPTMAAADTNKTVARERDSSTDGLVDKLEMLKV